MTLVIAVANQKGGVGKTTTTANLGAGLARLGKHVLLIDMDPQGNLTGAFGVKVKPGDPTVADALMDRDAPLPIRSVSNNGGKVHLVPASVVLAGTEAQLTTKLGRETRLRDQCDRVRSEYDVMLIDTPPSLGTLTINALVAADRVLVPTEARFFSLQGLQMIQQTIDEALYLNPKLRITGILISRYDRRLREERDVASYLRDKWGGLVFQTDINSNSKILEAASEGTTVFSKPGAGRAVEAFERLAKEVLCRG